MNLFILRHGQAHPPGSQWRPDSKRPLTKEGEEQTFEVARGMLALGLSFDAILTSPYARALRTAEILAEVYEKPKLIETRRLVPEADPKEIIDEIAENFADAEGIVLVGHEPLLSRLVSTLLSGGDGLAIRLKKAGLCKLSAEKVFLGQCARLHWLMTPRQLARLGKAGKG
jgi:phosphohistidine phosphatase